MPLWKNYHAALSISDAVQALRAEPGNAKVLAGGTDLLLDLRQGRSSMLDLIIDISTIPQLHEIRRESDQLFIGAAVPLNRIIESKLVSENAQALVEACGQIGGPQVRNLATLGGNVAHALPAADGTIALLAMGAKAEISDLDSFKLIPLQDLFVGPGQSVLTQRGELITGFYIPIQKKQQASAFKRVMRPQGVALPVLNLAIWLERTGSNSLDDVIEDIRISIGPGGPIPTRAYATEAFLRGKDFSGDLIVEAVNKLLSEVTLRTSPFRATSDYRIHLAGVLFEEVIYSAWKRSHRSSIASS
jgi:CO/xanthine dehydrogenase FAD-binding subunit